MESLIITIAKALVDYPDDVSVRLEEDEDTAVYTLLVNKEDAGKVIGKQGRTAQAIRTVVYAAATTHPKRVTLKIDEQG